MEKDGDKQVENNLRPNPAWVPGMPSPNPAGRPPRARCVADAFAEIGNEPDEAAGTKLRAVVRRVYADALGGEIRACALVFERLEGRAREAEIPDLDTDIDLRINIIRSPEDAAKLKIDQ
jgi:hypothetical protein